ncbi:MAG: hypothetical protein P8Y60_14390 [Calditrichota bacterium]
MNHSRCFDPLPASVFSSASSAIGFCYQTPIDRQLIAIFAPESNSELVEGPSNSLPGNFSSAKDKNFIDRI